MTASRLADYIGHIETATTDACSFVRGMSRDEFMADRRSQSAVVMCLVVIGEAATKVMDQHAAFVLRHPEVPWRSMRGMRNRVAHGYFDINLDVVWETVQSALPALLLQLPALHRGAESEVHGNPE